MLQTLPLAPQTCIEAQAPCAPSDAANGDAGSFARALRQAGSNATTATPDEQAPPPSAAPKTAQRPEARRGDHALRERGSIARATAHQTDDAAQTRGAPDATRAGAHGRPIDCVVSEPQAPATDAAAAASDDTLDAVEATTTALPDWRQAGVAPPAVGSPDPALAASAAAQPQAADLHLIDDTGGRRGTDEQPGPRRATPVGHGRLPTASTAATASAAEPRTDAAVIASAAQPERRPDSAPSSAAANLPAIAADRDAAAGAAPTPLPTTWFDNAPVAARETAATPTASASLGAAVGSREFAEAFGSQVVLWVRDGVQEARLQLHPAELGPVSIQIALDGAAARVDFHAAHAQTREAIEASLPALASALRESGFTLSGGGVFGQSAGDPGARAASQTAPDAPRAGHAAALPGRDALPGPEPRSRPWRRGLLDVFA